MDVTFVIKLQDLVSSGLKKVVGGATAASGAMNGLNKCLWKVNQSAELFERMGTTLTKINKPGLDFEQGMANLSAITGIAGDELEALGASARQIGIDSGLGAVQAVEAYKVLASQIDVAKIGMKGLQSLQKDTITLSQASGLEMAAAGEALAGTINQFGLAASESNRIINVLAAGSKYGAAEIPDLAQSFKVVGAAANAAGLSVEQTAGAIEVLSKNNLKGAEAGTAMRNMLLKMQTELGVDFNKTSMSDALDALKPRLKDTAYLTKLFGMENVVAAQFLIQNAGQVKEMTDRVTDTGVAQEQATINTNTWGHTLEKFYARMNDWGISLHEHSGGILNIVQMGSQMASGFASLFPLFQGLSAAVGGLARAFNWLSLAENRQMIVDKARTAWTWVSKAAITAWTTVINGARTAWAWLTAAETRQMIVEKARTAWTWVSAAAMTAWATVVGVATGQITLASITTKLWTGAQWLLNAALTANPIGLIVVAIAAVVAAVIVAVRHFETFGAAMLLLMGPIGWLVNTFMALKNNWDSIVEAFKSDGIIAGLKRIGVVMLDTVLYPVQQLLELLAKIPGMEGIAGGGAEKIAKIRESFNLVTPKATEEKKAEAGIGDKTPAVIAPSKRTSSPQSAASSIASSPSSTSSSASSGVSGTSGSGISIKIGNLIGSITFSGTPGENAKELEQQVMSAVTRALNLAAASA